jgi:O-antigen/teichoic acid export membrane protein
MTPGALRFAGRAKEGIWLVSGQAASVAASLVLLRVLTAFLDSTQYGDLALALTLGTLMFQIAFTGAMPGILRYDTVATDKGDVHQYFVESRRMMLFGTFAALVLCMLLMIGVVVAGKVESLTLVAVAIVFSILGSYDATFSMIQNAAQQRVVVAFHSAAGAWLKVLSVAALLSWTVKSGVVVVSGYLLSLLLVVASQSVFIKHWGLGSLVTAAVAQTAGPARSAFIPDRSPCSNC